MKKLKKIFIFFILIGLAYGAKYILFDFVVSAGKRVGSLSKISKRGKFIKTWEGTIDEGRGDRTSSHFSVYSDDLGRELYEYEGREVIIYYVEHMIAFPYETKFEVTSWKPKAFLAQELGAMGEKEPGAHLAPIDESLLRKIQTTLFCSFLGALRSDRDLYIQVKNFMKKNNHYLHGQYSLCRE